MLIKNKINDLVISLVIGIIACFPVSGFIFGFINCSDCKNSILGFLGRIFIGFIYSFLSIITLGKPWNNEGGTSATDIRLYVLITFLVISGIIFLYRKRKGNR